MFFFGAFSGNLIYLILAISYLAGCSTLVLRSTDDKEKEIKSTEAISAPILFDSTSRGYPVQYYTIHTDHANQAITEEFFLRPPLHPTFAFLFSSPLISLKSHFSGSAQFSRPPPYFLV